MGTSSSDQKISSDITEIYDLCYEKLKQKSMVFNYMEKKVSYHIVNQLFSSFERVAKYSWAQQMLPLFKIHFLKNFPQLWKQDKEKFYTLLFEGFGFKSSMKSLSYQQQFYNKISSSYQEIQECDEIKALNKSILEDEQSFAFISNKKCNKQRKNSEIQNDLEVLIETTDEEFDRSSLITPEAVFVNRLSEQSKQNVSCLLKEYKCFSETLQMMMKTLSILSCPLKHFETSLKKIIKKKKIRRSGASQKLLKNTKEAETMRKNKQVNNIKLLSQIRDFIDAYTQFLWKYLDLFKINNKNIEQIISLETVCGIVLKIVWQFTSWIGDRGFEWEQMQLEGVLAKVDKLIQKKNQIPQQIVQQACSMKDEVNPQKYLKRVVILYRQLSQLSGNADELLSFYEKLVIEVIKRKCYNKMFRMESIVNKLIKIQQLGGEIEYAWTTWSIILQFLRKAIEE